MRPRIVLSINTAWNLVNFRSGLLRRLVEEGFDVVAAAPPDDYVERLCAMGVRFAPIGMDRKGLSPARDLGLLWRYQRLLRREAPAAYLGWTIKPNIWGGLAARLLRVPAIHNVSGLGTAFMKPGLVQFIVRRLYRVAFRRSQTVFFQNSDDRREFVESGLVEADRTALLPGSGIDLRYFSPAEPPRSSNGRLVFLMIARLLGDKGVREFADAARQLRAAGLAARFQLLGAIDHDNRSAIRPDELSAWLDEGVIEHIAPVDDVRPVIASADCVVLPSYREGMPRSLLEGAAMAKPLVATDIPGCRPIARPGENAVLCRVADTASLAEALGRVAALSPQERARMGAASRRIAEQEFDEAVVIERYLAAVERAMSAGG